MIKGEEGRDYRRGEKGKEEKGGGRRSIFGERRLGRNKQGRRSTLTSCTSRGEYTETTFLFIMTLIPSVISGEKVKVNTCRI